LKVIHESKDPPYVRLARFQRDAVPAIVKATGISCSSPDYDPAAPAPAEYRELFDTAAIVLRGISLDAWNDFQDGTTAVAANELAINYACKLDMKERLLADRATLKTSLEHQHTQVYSGTAPLQLLDQSRFLAAKEEAARRQSAHKPGAGCLVAVAGFIVLIALAFWNSASTTPTPTDASANQYRVPNSQAGELNTERAEIEAQRATLDALQTRIQTLGLEVERDRLALHRSSQSAVDDFNAKVDRYNALAQEGKAANTAFNAKVDTYNAKLHQNGR